MTQNKSFHDFGISDKVLVTLSDMGFEEPTPIQRITIPPLLAGKDIIGQAQTGTGKTAAFGIPMIELRGEVSNVLPYALVMAPTRELAVQVSEELNKIGARVGVSAVPIYGGQSIELQIKRLKRGVDIIVGTPGRMLDHLQRKTLNLSRVKFVVLDEADEMLNMGFIEDITKILDKVPSERQTMLFSATMPAEIMRIGKKYMKDAQLMAVDASEMVVAKIKQVFYEVRDEDKLKALTRLLDVEGPTLTLVFCHTKREVDEVSGKLQQMGYPAGAIHGDFTQSHRDDMIRKFKGGDLDILVATDVAARGLDIPDVSHVINYSIPQDPEGYIHRVGRTGRAGKSGIAITFVNPRQYRQLKLIEQSAKTRITKEKLPTREQVRKAKEEDLIGSVEEMVEEGEHKNFLELARTLLEKMSPEDVCAAALGMLWGEDDIAEIKEYSSSSSSSSSSSRPSYAGRKGDIVRLFMTVGKKDNIKVGDIIKSISAEAGIPARNIGNIALLDSYSFIEVPADMADKVILAVNDSIMKGKKIRIQHAKERTTTQKR